MKKRTLATLVAIFWCIALVACSSSTPPAGNQSGGTGATAYPLTFTDASGAKSTIEASPQKIVSVSPGVTETLFAVGAGPRVIADCEWCDYPPEAASLETIGNAYAVNTERIIELGADLVLVSGTFGNDAVAALANVNIPVVNVSYDTVESVYKSIEDIGLLTDCQKAANDLVAKLKSDLDSVKAAYAGTTKNKVFIDLGELFSSSQHDFLGNTMQLLNCDNIAYNQPNSSPQLSSEKVIEENPDVYIATFPEAGAKFPDGFQEINAFKNKQVFYLSYDDPIASLILRQGPRFVDGLKELGKMIHPEVKL